jgi:hypothetical protein
LKALVAAAEFEALPDWSPRQLIVSSGTLEIVIDHLETHLSGVEQRLDAFEKGLVCSLELSCPIVFHS